MSVPETVLIYAGIPLGIIAVMAAAVFLPAEVKSPTRYRPGRPWPHPPSWYLPHELPAETPALESAHARLALGPEPDSLVAPVTAPKKQSIKAAGGASGEW